MPSINLSILIRALLVWLLLVLAESVHGSIRHILTDPDFEFVVRQASVVTAAAITFALTWFSMRWMRVGTGADALAVGALWVALTLAFEVLAGRLLGYEWNRIGSDYDLAHGGLMPLGLLAMALTPLVVRRLQARKAAAVQ